MELTAAPTPTGPLLVGYSGGLDSTVLLHLLAADEALRSRGLRALHVHHGLHADADDWARHCTEVCAALGIPLAIAHVTVDKDAGEGLEAAARHARHGAFQAQMQAGETLVLAHHLDDQAETFLLRALRASGPDGLGAMQPWRAFAEGWLWRPLLDTPRNALEDYATQHGLRWIDDPSNDNPRHDRNFLRSQVLPVLRQRWPQASAALARSAELQREATALLDNEDVLALAHARSLDPACLRVDTLLHLPVARRARVLRRWTAECGLPPLPAQGVDWVEQTLSGTRADAAPEFVWSDAVLRRWQGVLWAEIRRPDLPAGFSVHWDGLKPLPLPTGGCLHWQLGGDASAQDWRVHARRGGERITLPGRSHSHSLKHVLQSLAIPPWLRQRMPLLSNADGELLAAGDLVYSADLDARLCQHDQRLLWQDNPL